MYKEMDSDGQYNLDCRLSGERGMDENVAAIIDFATGLRTEQANGTKVRNRHEGYGFLADAHQAVVRTNKAVKDGMTELLNVLPADDAAAVDKVESIVSALEDTIKATIEMAAEAKRVSHDLFAGAWSGSDTGGDVDGFFTPEEE